MAQANVKKAIQKNKVGRRKLATKVNKARRGTEGTKQKNMVRSGLGGKRV